MLSELPEDMEGMTEFRQPLLLKIPVLDSS